MADLDTMLSGRSDAPANNTEPTNDTNTEHQSAQADAGTQEPQGGDGGQPEPKTVPIEALHAERAKGKRYTEALTTVEQRLQEQGQLIERLVQSLQPPKQPPQQAEAPDWYQDPNRAAVHAIAPHLQRVEQAVMANAQMIARQVFGEDQVQAAEAEFVRLYESGQLHPSEYQRVMSDPNRYAAAVQWHRQRQALAEIGTDPAAYKEKLKQELLSELQAAQGGQPQPQAQAQPVMPSNLANARNVGSRSGPAWGGPLPLDDIFSRRRPQT